ncbi:MAG: hypothetical protein WCQ16_08725 [Verrucomicrobiae bacterium]
MRILLFSLFAALPLFGGTAEADPQRQEDAFQATIRGDATSGVAVFSPSGSRAFSGNVVIFHKGRQFKGTSQGRTEGGQLIFTFEASAGPDAKSPARLLTGTFKATGEPSRFSGSGALQFSTGKNDPKPSAQLPIKVSGIQMPKVTGR